MLFETFFAEIIGAEGIKSFEESNISLPTGEITDDSIRKFLLDLWKFLLTGENGDVGKLYCSCTTALICAEYLGLLTPRQLIYSKEKEGVFCMSGGEVFSTRFIINMLFSQV